MPLNEGLFNQIKIHLKFQFLNQKLKFFKKFYLIYLVFIGKFVIQI